MASTPVGTIRKYQQAIGIKKRNEYIQAWAAPCARDVAVVFWATWRDIEARIPKDEDQDFKEADTPAKRRGAKNKYNAIVREAVRKHTAELQSVLEYYDYKAYLAGFVEQARKLGCLNWALSKSVASVMDGSAPEKPKLNEADDKLTIKHSLSLPNYRAQKYAKKYAAEAVTNINSTTRKEIARIVQQGVDSGMSYGDIAKTINAKFEQFAVPKPQKHIANRGVLVAVTELANAYCQANYEVGEELQKSGVKMMKIWSTMEDDRVSDGCRANQDAGWIELDKPFPSGDMTPPRFPGCRCDFYQDLMDESMLGRSADDYFDRPDEGRNLPTRSLDLGSIADDIRLNVYDESGMKEIMQSPDLMNMTKTARERTLRDIEKIQTYEQFESYLSDRGVELDTSTNALKTGYYSRDFPSSVKSQVNQIIAAINQYDELGGIRNLKKIHIWDGDLEVQAQYVYNAIGEDDPEANEIFFKQGETTLHQVMHEFAHAFADSMKPEGEDVVSWSAKLNDLAGLDGEATAYFGAATDVIEAEKFADNFSYAFTASKGRYEDSTKFFYNVMDVLKKIKEQGLLESGGRILGDAALQESYKAPNWCNLEMRGRKPDISTPNDRLNVNEGFEKDIIRDTICRKCKYFSGFNSRGNPTCTTFGGKIPDSFWQGNADHTTPYNGDGGITFSPYAS